MNNNNVWGPSAWTFLHTITYNYPENPSDNDKKNYHNFFDSLQHVLPCDKCKGHYKQNIQKYDLNNSLDNREDLVKWLIDLHNDVNRDNGKKVWSYSEVYNKYDNLHNSNLVNKILIFVILCIVLVLIFFLYKTYGKKGCK
tara:strand:+ start:127 stop:549 length:423 start_codon:yes stop_codon:yes gene_type:complete